MKYGVVGAIALAVLVAAMWDGSKKKKTDEVARTDDTVVTGDIGSGAVTSVEPPRPTPLPTEVAKVEPPRIEDVLEKYQVQKGDTLKSIARRWLGDEKLAEALYEANKTRIPDAKRLSAHLTLVFPRSKFAVKTPDTSTVPGGFKKDEVKTTEVPAGEKKYVVKDGDTLYGIAARELGKGSRWKEIQKLNNMGGDTLKKGQTIVLPTK